ncbi:hypothetical protein [Streptomyces sp. NPDC049879]|uniref:hypothetical protein n=1 Tax=Streptomyces sp. NPDC049879 TaxID=3365598 RepID=UPI003793A2BC
MKKPPATDPCPRCAELGAQYDDAVVAGDPAAGVAALVTALVHMTAVHAQRVGGRTSCGTCRQFLVLLRGDQGGPPTGWRRDAGAHFVAHVLDDTAAAVALPAQAGMSEGRRTVPV